MSPMSTAVWACALVVVASAVTDFATRKIPNIISLGGIVTGLAIHTATGAVDGFGGAARGLGFALLGLFTVSIAPFIFWKRGEMGGGDVKLLAAVGALLGPVIGFDVLAFTFAASLLVLLPYRLVRHNAVAVSLIIKGDRCYSVMDGRRKDWSPWATSITPPVTVHSHHNGGNEQAMFLIVQDGGLFYHTRAMGFEFVEQPA